MGPGVKRRNFVFLIEKNRRALFLLLACAVAFAPASLQAASITLTGTFAQDDTVQVFDVVVATGGTVDFRSYGYGGGSTATGQTVAAGGFDTVLTLFSSTGAFLTENDDGTDVAPDPLTEQAFDARITTNLLPGQYILALTQYDNFATGATLNDGFDETGYSNFTADPSFTAGPPCPSGLFRDSSNTAGQCRNGNWTVDFVNVASVAPRSAVPEPQSAFLLGCGLLSLAVMVRKCSSLD
jgi:hypothetical protein